MAGTMRLGISAALTDLRSLTQPLGRGQQNPLGFVTAIDDVFRAFADGMRFYIKGRDDERLDARAILSSWQGTRPQATPEESLRPT